MTLQTDTNKIIHEGNGVTVNFPFPNRFLQNEDLTVILTDTNGNDALQDIVTDYSVIGAGEVDGGTVIMVVTPAQFEILTIVREVAFTQLNDYQQNEPFPSDTIEDTFDKNTMMSQQLDEITGRTIKLPITSILTDVTIDDLPGNESKTVTVNSNATGFTYTQLLDQTQVGNFDHNVFSGTGSQTDFTLSFTPANVNSLLVSVDDVTVEPTVDYTFSGTTLTFTTPPSSGTGNIWVTNWAAGTVASIPSDGSVTTIKIANGAVTSAKLSPAIITEFPTITVLQDPDLFAIADDDDSGNTKNITWADVKLGLPTAPPDTFATELFHVQDQRSNGVAGDTPASGANQNTRTLNTVLTNEISGASLGSNQITLPVGTYYIDAWGSCTRNANNKGRLRNVTDASTTLVGSSEFSNGSASTPRQETIEVKIHGRFTLPGTKVLEFEHYSTSTVGTRSFGTAATSGDTELYADVRIWKIA